MSFFKMKSGIYYIKNKCNNKMYIGQSIDLERRKKEHLSHLRNNKHKNNHLQKSFNKYGEKAFEIKTYIVCPEDELSPRETLLIIFYATHNPKYGYNKTFGGEREDVTDEIRQKISNKKKQMYKEGLIYPQDNLPDYYKNGSFSKEILSKKFQGKHFSSETEFSKGNIPYNKNNGKFFIWWN